MKLADIIKALAGLDNGDLLKSTLLDIISALEGDRDAAKEKLKLAEKILGTDETKYSEVAKQLSDAESLQRKNERLTTELDETKGKLKQVERKQTINEFAAVAKANPNVLSDLLGDDVDLKVEKDKALIKVDGKYVEFSKYVEDDARLSLYTKAIFVEAADNTRSPDTETESTEEITTTTITTQPLPKEKGSNKPQDPMASYFNEYQKQYKAPLEEAIAQRFTK